MAHLRFPLPNGIPHEHDPLPNPHPEDDLFLDDEDGGFGVYLAELGIGYEEYQTRRRIFYFCLSLFLSFYTVAFYLFSNPDTILQFPWVRSHLQDDVYHYHHAGRFALKFKDMEREFKINDDAIRVVCKSKIGSNEILLPPLHIPKRASYEAKLIFITKKDAMFCVCSGRSQITTACITKSILDGCIPDFLSTYSRLPFKRILDWDKFSLRIERNDTYELHNLVHRIKASDSFTLHSNLLKVQKSFKWNSPPSRFDAFHMAIFELWECYNQNLEVELLVSGKK
uniref:Exostosin GT47 domain-containing protein n=1 Tax=Quercus lobata TaxID=97700 RepID=A0A7N2RE09_QUELO